MTSFIDPEFGEITVNRRRGSRSVRIKLGLDGRLVSTAPLYTPVIFIKRIVGSSRSELRKMLQQPGASENYTDGQIIGKNHQLVVVQTSMVKKPSTKVVRQKLLVYLPPGNTIKDTDVQQIIRDSVIKILRREAKATLPGRLQALAAQHGFSYQRIRFSHSSGRWGSCSSAGTISLNIALMKLPDELINYVLLHELCHTRQMNHSPAFWDELQRYDPHLRLHKRQIKLHTPSV